MVDAYELLLEAPLEKISREWIERYKSSRLKKVQKSTVNRELDLIDSLTEDTPEYALWKTDRLLEVIEERDVRVEHFARVSQDEMNSAQKLLDRAAVTRMKLISLLEGSDGD